MRTEYRGKFMKTIVVNLDRDKNRWRFISEGLSRYGFAYERFPAVDGKAISEVELKKCYCPAKAKRLSHLLTAGELGCALSHIKIYQKIVREKIPLCLILEDDAEILPALGAVVRDLEKILDPLKNDVVMVGPRAWKIFPSDVVLPQSKALLCKTFSPYCTTAYVVTYEAARRLADFLLPVVNVADNWARFEKYGLVNMLSVNPQPVALGECAAVSSIDGRAVKIDYSYKAKLRRWWQRSTWGNIDSLCALFYKKVKNF